MIFDIVEKNTMNGDSLYFVEIPEREFYYDATEAVILMYSCGFKNVRVGCFGQYENCIVFIE